MPELLEERQAKVEATLEQMDKRLSNVEVMLRDLNAKIDTNFRWMIGMWITTILAFLTTILTILLKG